MMKINDPIATELNQQIGRELFSSNLYLAMAYFFEERALDGFATWFKRHSDEERGHANQIATYLVDRSGHVTIDAQPAIKANWKNPLAVLKEAFDHEQAVTEFLRAILKTASTADDCQTERLMEDLLMEQVEEEKVFGDLLQQAQLLQDSPLGIFTLNVYLKE